MPTHRIAIQVGRGGARCVPDSVRVKRRDTVRWTCARGPYEVRFGWDSPFPDVSYSGQKGRAASAKVRRDACPGRYKYFVAVYDGRKVVTDDPDIIIR